MTGYFLIVLTVAAAIVGTLSEANRQIKLTLIGIAVLSGVASAWVYFEDQQKSRLNERLIASLVHSLQQTEIFAEELRLAINDILDNRDLHVSSFEFSDNGAMIGIADNATGDMAGLIYAGNRDLRPVRYALIAGTGLDAALRDLLVEDVWTPADLNENWNVVAPEVGHIMAYVIDPISPFTDSQTSLYFEGGETVAVEVVDAYSATSFLVRLEMKQLQELIGLDPVARGGRISEMTAEAFLEQL